MSFASKLGIKEPIIDSLEDAQRIERSMMERRLFGRTPRSFSAVPYGSMRGVPAFNLPTIPRSLWAAMVEKQEATKTRLSDLVRYYKIPSLDQDGTNFCWCNAVVTAIESYRAMRNLGYVKLSAASVAAQIKRYSNQGGWGGEALDFIIESGIAPASLWPENYWQSSKYLTSATKSAMLLNRVTGWIDIRPDDFAMLATCCLLRIPVAIGLNWWSHEVCAFDLVVLGSNKFGIRIRNSWGMDYGEDGFAILTESKATPDDACGIVLPGINPQYVTNLQLAL